jgi:AcrR family transcriptional regulator
MARTRTTARRTQRERSDATVSELLAAARELFAQDGYAATSLDAVAAAAGVTKGALYHHFGGKKELFAAVVEHEQRRLAAITTEAYRREGDPWDGFQAGCRAFLEASADPAVQQITLLDAPSVLGWDTIRTMNSNASFANTASGLEAAMKAGRIPRRPVEPLAHLLFGAICEGANVIARSEDQAAAVESVLTSLGGLLDGLAQPGA